MNSIFTQIPFSYYYLGIVPPEKLEPIDNSLGGLLTGDVTYETVYNVRTNFNFSSLERRIYSVNTSARRIYTFVILTYLNG